MAAAVLLLLCTTVLVLYYNYSNIQQEQGGRAVGKQVKSSQALSVPIPTDTEIIYEIEADSSVSRSIAAVVPSEKVAIGLKRSVTNSEDYVIDDVTPEELMSEMDEKAHERYISNIMEGIDSPSLATATPAKLKATEAEVAPAPSSLSLAPSTVPESTKVANALQGKAAGVSVRGMSSLSRSGNTREVSGQVLSEDGQPLPGVTVRLKGTNLGTTTDPNGNFSLSVAQANTILQFYFIGYETAEKAIAANTTSLNVQMTTDNQALSEVVVVGYGSGKPVEAPAVVAAKPIVGYRAYRKYLKENLNIPAGSARGKVVVGFTVSASGAVKDVQVLESLCPACDAEAIRLISEGPAWKAASQAGSPVQQQIKVTVRFRSK
ncbi:hypothetical protein GCM10007389_07300 [Pontibacter akesuensis]|nr:hypothetical protein GCM10007389_07300 [Pontibacter akesuensis]